MKKILLLLISVMGVQMVNAQKGYGTVTYSAATPLGDMTNYIDKISYRGINAELYWHIKQNFDAGVEVGWNVFNNREDKKTYTEETRSITGVQYRYVNAVPIIAGLRWRKTGGNLQPYLGAGLGTSSMNRSTDFGLYRIVNNTWQFCVRPEGGIIYKLSDATGATLGLKYYMNFENDDQEAQSFLTLNVGFVFGLSHW